MHLAVGDVNWRQAVRCNMALSRCQVPGRKTNLTVRPVRRTDPLCRAAFSEPHGRPKLAMFLAVATLVSGVVLAGCGGSSGTMTAAKNASATDTGPSTRGSPPTDTQTHQSALNFAKCMRANGVSSFPDPNPGGGFAFHASAGVVSSPAFREAQAKCQRFMPGGGPLSPGPPPSAKTMALLRRIAMCMRQHGVPQFPDPRTSAPPGFNLFPEYREATNYMGAILLFPATIDPQSPAYQRATAACGAGFLAGNNAH